MTPRVAFFIDYQNVHMSGHRRYCGAHDDVWKCLLHPARLADRILSKRAPGGTIVDIRVYRGKPDPRKEPTLTSANDQHFSEWIKDPRVTVKRRPLSYPEGWQQGDVERPREKGIDVSLAVDMVRLAYEKKFDVAILVSRDTDLLPPIEMLRDLKLAHVEVAGWDGSTRIRLPKLWYHELDESDFVAARDNRPYVVR